MEELNNYSFKVDGGLNVGARAADEKTALIRIQTAWPRSKIVLVGINLPQAQRTVSKSVASVKAPVKTRTTTPVKEDKVEALASKLGVTETEASLLSQFA